MLQKEYLNKNRINIFVRSKKHHYKYSVYVNRMPTSVSRSNNCSSQKNCRGSVTTVKID